MEGHEKQVLKEGNVETTSFAKANHILDGSKIDLSMSTVAEVLDMRLQIILTQTRWE